MYINSPSSLFCKVTLAFLVLLSGLLLSSSAIIAHPPSNVELNYRGETKTLQVKVSHSVGNPSSHYVEKVTVTVNGERAITKDYEKQNKSSGSSFEYKLDVQNGDLIEVEAECNRFGAASGTLEVEGVPAENKSLLRATLLTDRAVPSVREETPRSARGEALMMLDREDNVLSFALTYKGLSGRPTEVQFHRGEKGETGAAVASLFGGSSIEGIPEEPPEGTSNFLSGKLVNDGEGVLTEELAEAFLAGEIYLSVKTELNAEGEIRGRILEVS